MRTHKPVFASLVAVLALSLVPERADARFGKRSSSSNAESSSSNNSSSSSSKRSSNSNSSSSGEHASAPISTPVPPARSTSSRGTSHSGHASQRSPSHHHHGHRTTYVYTDPWYGPSWGYGWSRWGYGWSYGYQPYWFGPAPSADVKRDAPRQEQQEPQLAAAFGIEGQLHGEGAGLGVSMGIEGDRFGFTGQFTGIFARADDGSSGIDNISLLDAHLTWAPLRGEHGRVRLEGGVSSAFASDIIFLGPDVGASAAIGLLGPVGAEASFHLTPFPYVQADAYAGLNLTLGPAGIRAGWRHIYLNDLGKVDGIAHADTFSGPFVGLSLSL